MKLKGNIYKIVVRPAMLYGAETWATTKGHEVRIDTNDMRLLRWMCEVTTKEKIRKEYITETTGVKQKITEKKLKLPDQVMRRDDEHIVKRVLMTDIAGRREVKRTNKNQVESCLSKRHVHRRSRGSRDNKQSDMGEDHQ